MLTMDGFTIGDEDTYASTYEKDITKNGSSGVVKGVSIKKDGMFTARVFAPDTDEYALIGRAAAACVNDIHTRINGGIFDVAPYKKKDVSACRYCGYSGACGFDLLRRDAAFRVIVPKSDKAYIPLLKELYGRRDLGATGGSV